MKDFFQKESILIIVVVLLGLAGAAFIIYAKTQHRAELAAVPVTASASPVATPVGIAMASAPTPVPSAAAAEKDQTKELGETPGCASPHAAQSADSGKLQVPNDRRWDFKDGKTVSILIDSATATKNCFREDESYSVDVSIQDSHILIYRAPLGKARIKRLVSFPVHDLSAAIQGHIDLELLKTATEIADDKDSLIYMADIVADGLVTLTHAEMPKDHPMAKTVTKKDVIELQSKGALLIDTRNDSKFAFKTIPGAINVSFELFNTPASLFMKRVKPSQHLAVVAEIEKRFPKDKKARLILFGRSDRGLLVYNAISIFASHGYENLFWYRPGFEDWFGISYPTPEKGPGFSVVNADQTFDLINKKNAFVVDTRTVAAFVKIRMRAASSFPFNSQRDQSDMTIYRPLKPTIADLKKNKEGFEDHDIKKIPKGRIIVIVGSDEYDWAPYKAAAWLTQAGYDVRWMRGGFAEYLHRAVDNPTKFFVEPPLDEL